MTKKKSNLMIAVTRNISSVIIGDGVVEMRKCIPYARPFAIRIPSPFNLDTEKDVRIILMASSCSFRSRALILKSISTISRYAVTACMMYLISRSGCTPFEIIREDIIQKFVDFTSRC